MKTATRYYLGLLKSPGKWDRTLRTWVLKRKGLRIGRKAVVRFPFNYRYLRHIKIGEGAVIGEYGFLVAGPKSHIRIGKNALLAPNVHINTVQHNYKSVETPINFQGSSEADVEIGEDCWLGTGVIVLKGVRIGKGTVVGAGSVVIKDTGNYNVMAGVPAKFMKKRWE